MRKFLPAFLVLIVILTALSSCINIGESKKPPTDEELIRERIEDFLTAYNSGNFELVLENLDAKTRNSMNAMFNILGGIMGGAVGFDISFSDLFSLGINTTSGDFLELEIHKIVIKDEKSATVKAAMSSIGIDVCTIYVEMVYEHNGWYIHDMTDNKPADFDNIIADNSIGTNGLKLSYTINSSGTGYALSDIELGTETTVVIPSTYNQLPVTEIGESAFYKCYNLVSLTLPDTITEIGRYAFYQCVNLTSITIPNNVKKIGDNSFSFCENLSNITIPDGVTDIGKYAFSGCEKLVAVTIPGSVTMIGDSAFSICTALQDVTIEKSTNSSCTFGKNVFDECLSLDRIYFTGTSEDWALFTINQKNSYPLDLSPYYYSASSPTDKGNYWYYNSKGQKRVWNLNDSSFKAEEYSEWFADSSFGSSDTSLASQLLSQLDSDKSFKARIERWESLRIATGSVWDSKLISKKDLYKMVIYDLLTGEANNKTTISDCIEKAAIPYSYEYAKFLLGSDSMTKEELQQLNAVDYNYIEFADKFFKGLDVIKVVFEMSVNMYEALNVCTQYSALIGLDENINLILTEIANDHSLPMDLRLAATESAEYYKLATQNMLEMIVLGEFTEDAIKSCVDALFEKAWKNILGAIFPGVAFISFTTKGIMFLLDVGFNVDACNEAYYQLEATVGLENALRNVIKNTLPDYYRYECIEKSEYYMYAIDMYQTSVLLGFEYSNDLLCEHSKSANVNAEEREEYAKMIAQILEMKQTKTELFSSFESATEQYYDKYYS